MNWVIELVVVHNPDQEADDSDQVRQSVAEFIDFLFKRVFFFGLTGSRYFFLDTANSGFHSGEDNNTDGVSESNDS